LGASGSSAIRTGEWEIGVVYRWLHANRFYIGRVEQPLSKTPFFRQVRINNNSISLNVRRAVSTRLSVNLGIPFATVSEQRGQDDSLSHRQSATGLGDINLVGSMWVFDPNEHGQWNISLGLGVKAPTGVSAGKDTYHLVSGTEQRYMDPSTQLGDGGWGLIAQIEAYHRLFHRTSAYVAGSYLANPKGNSDATFRSAYGIVPVAVTDEYSAHAGVTYVVLPSRGLTFSLGGRVDGVPVYDRFGGGDLSFRRPGYVAYVEPNINWVVARSPFSSGGSTFSISVPYSVDRNRMASALDAANGKHGGGDFAKYLVFLAYSKRM
jgi:hypothetical protein